MIGKIIITIGAVAIGICYIMHKKAIRRKKTAPSRSSVSHEKKTLEIFESRELTMDLLQAWFDKNSVGLFNPKFFLLYAAPGKAVVANEKVKHFICNMHQEFSNIPTDRDIIFQTIVDSSNNRVVDVRAVTFESIEKELDTLFEKALYHDGMIEIEQ